MLGWGPWAVEVLGLSVFGLAWSVVGDVDGLSWAGGMARRVGGPQGASLFVLDAVDRLHTRKSHSRRLAKNSHTHTRRHTHARARFLRDTVILYFRIFWASVSSRFILLLLFRLSFFPLLVLVFSLLHLLSPFALL